MQVNQHVGRVSVLPKLTHVGQNNLSKVTFGLAIDSEISKDKTNFLYYEAIGKTADLINKFVRTKGTILEVSFEIQSRQFTNSNGEQRTVYTNVTPRPSSVASTPLNKAQSFGPSGKTATLFSKTFNPDNNTLLLKFALANGSGDVDSAVDTRNIKLAVEGNGTGDATMHIIPTSKNTVAILFNNVNPNFQSVTVKVADKQTNALASSAPDTVSALSSSRAAESSAKKNDDGIATFIVNSDKLKTDKTLVNMNQKKLALLQVKSDIADQKKLLAANNSAIKNANKDIKELQKDITFQSAQKQNATADEQQKYQQTIDNDLNKIQDLTQKITTTRDTIQTINQKISNLESRQSAIKTGQVNLPKPY